MNNSTKNTETLNLSELKRHREQKKITEHAVADGMKVSKDFVHYIESGEFEKLGAPTFVRGHITNYCKSLGIEPGSILAQIPGHVLQHQQLKTSDGMGGSPLSHVRRQSNHFGRYAIGTALLGMLCMSFYFIWDKWSFTNGNQASHDLSISQQDTDSVDEKKVTYSSLIPQITGPNRHNMVQPNIEPSVGESSTESSLVPTEVDNLEIEHNNLLNVDTPENVEEPNVLSTVDDTQPDMISNTSLSAYSIVMEFEEEAWVSIKTLDGALVVQDLLGPGSEEFQVTEPVHFRIGNAQKMQLIINEDTVELAPLINRNIADFNWPLDPNS